MSVAQGEVDRLSDRLADAAEKFRSRRDELLKEIKKACEELDAECVATEKWALKQGLIDSEDWTDDAGEPFFPVLHFRVEAAEVPDLSTLFRERVASLASGEHP